MDDDSIRWHAEVGQQQEEEAMKYAELRKLDVSKYVEKKNGLTYLSWAWAVDQLLMHDASATWTYRESSDGVPFVRIGETAMVFCTVTAFSVARTAQLPVMDHRNRPIPNPDAFQVNTAMQRCLAKAIALHGIGLYIYNGEDLPPDTKDGGSGGTGSPDQPDVQSDIRKLADELIKQFGIAETEFAADGDTRGYWKLRTMVKDGVGDGEDKLVLWAMLKPHTALRAVLKEYEKYEREGGDRKVPEAA